MRHSVDIDCQRVKEYRNDLDLNRTKNLDRARMIATGGDALPRQPTRQKIIILLPFSDAMLILNFITNNN